MSSRKTGQARRRSPRIKKQVWKGKNEHNSTDSAVETRRKQNHRHGKPSILPSKQILELVLDTLQRRDTYEIFAEPVDPDEAKDYYEIIKEPMDFGTMRAKLHEGMYHDLEQFEHDVFLIPENAMYFNSSATIYFRQGRSIHELAKKVFDALKADPEKFVLEFSGTRRRSMRKALSNTKDTRVISANLGSGIVSPMPTENKSHSQRSTKESLAADRRFTYWACTSNSDNRKSLLQMNVQRDINYKESLMTFVKALGPIAQMVAERKLDHHPTGESARVFKTFSDFAGGGRYPFLKASKVVDQTHEDRGENDRKRSRKNLKNDHSNAGLERRPVILALENSHSISTIGEYRSKINGIGRSSSQFTFDLPFLQARLCQMNRHHHSIKAESMAVKPFLYTPSFHHHETKIALPTCLPPCTTCFDE